MKPLTDKQQKFADAILAGKSNTEAYRIAYATDANDKTASSEGAKLRKHAGIAAAIEAGESKQASDNGITPESHAAELIRTRDDARRKGDHATVLRCQESLAAFLKVKDEPDQVPDLASDPLIIPALSVLNRVERKVYVACLKEVVPKLVAEVERLRAGGEPITIGEAADRNDAEEDAGVNTDPDTKCDKCGLRPLDPRTDSALHSWIMKTARHPDETGLTPAIDRSLRAAKGIAASWVGIKGGW